jgi:hypothetical protein
MGPTALLPLRIKSCYEFLSPLKIHRSRPVLNSRTLGSMSSTITTRPPRAIPNCNIVLFLIIPRHILWDYSLCDKAPCSLVEVYRRFRGAYCLNHQANKSLTALMMDAVITSETSVYFNETTRRYIIEGSNLPTRRCENLNSLIT